jgi:hypothetical protein
MSAWDDEGDVPRYPVTLETGEFLRAIHTGAARERWARLKKLKRTATNREPEHGWSYHIDGACAEAAVAALFGLHWRGVVGIDDRADVARLEARSAAPHHKHMLLHRHNPADRPYILVRGYAPVLVVMGWIYGYEGQLEKEYWGSPHGNGTRECFMVPIKLLRDVATIPPQWLQVDEAQLPPGRHPPQLPFDPPTLPLLDAHAPAAPLDALPFGDDDLPPYP